MSVSASNTGPRAGRIMVGALSLIMVALGVLVVAETVEMPLWVGIFFLSLGIMGGFLTALPAFVALVTPKQDDSQGRS